MISPYTALNSPLTQGNAAASPLATTNKMHSVANDNPEGSEHNDVLSFAMVAAQSLNTAHQTSAMASTGTSINNSETTIVRSFSADSAVATNSTLQQQSPDIKAALNPVVMGAISKSSDAQPAATSTTSVNANQTAPSLPQLSQQSYSPQPMQNGGLKSAPSIIQNAFQATATTQPAIAALTHDALASEALESSQHVVGGASRNQATVAQWGPVSVSQAAPMMQQAQEMLSPLREQLRFQIDQQIKQAELRLDPPELGKVELNIRLDGDRLHIQMHAANPAVRDALLMGLDRLRNELAMDHGGQIDVDINQEGEQKKHNQQPHTTTIAAASLSNTDSLVDSLSQQDEVDLLA
ncbi:flagellar hook-length control protein FliK [Shewanella sp. 10N.286.45.A1]|uniref:flagellar hook-length control protein FliK n=1 Tax=Shewanella sp. 10N.286.45.A1 TaxID=3229694 RepID=UPI00354F8E8F